MAASRTRPPDSEHVTIAVDGPIVTVTLVNEQRKNAITHAMWGELTEAFTWVASDASVRVLVVTGAGTDFCSGADLSGDDQPAQHGLAMLRHINAACLALAAVPQPTIARVDGVAVGAGLNLALGCDLVVATDRSRFSEIFARRGMSIDFGGSWFLPRRVGLHKAKELALLAQVIDAGEAEALGLVNKVVAPQDLDGAVAEWVDRLAAGPPIALAQTKALLNASSANSLAAALDGEAAAQTINFATDDFREALQAFLQKRDPIYRGS